MFVKRKLPPNLVPTTQGIGVPEGGMLPDVRKPIMHMGPNGKIYITMSSGNAVYNATPKNLFRQPNYGSIDFSRNEDNTPTIQFIANDCSGGELCPYCHTEIVPNLIEEYSQEEYGEVLGNMFICEKCGVFWVRMFGFKTVGMKETSEW